jgi:PAS domain S-box-containing protein
MRKRTHFIKLIRLWGIISLIGIGSSIVAVDVIATYRDFNSRADQMRADYIARQKQIIKQEVNLVVDLISYEKEQGEILTRNLVKSRAYEAYSVARNIYRQNKTAKTKAEIQKMILDALRPIRFEYGSGYYFVIRLDGVGILSADKPETEGLNLLAVQDTHGQYVIKDMIKIVRQSGEGFYEYHWTKPDSAENDLKKISFIKRFEPYGWYIGTGLYVDDVESQIKANLLSAISRIRFGKEGYIFINRLNGDALVSNGELFPGTKKLWEVFNKNPEKMKDIFDKEYNAALKPEGDFIYYSFIKLTNPNKESPKASFIRGIPDWHWLVGAGVYLDDVETDIALMQTKLNNRVKEKMFYFILIVMGIVALFSLFFNWLNRGLRNDFNFMVSFFNRAVHSNEEIDRELIKFVELDQMAEHANKMLTDRKQAEVDLRESEQRFRELFDNMSSGVAIYEGVNNGNDFIFKDFNKGGESIEKIKKEDLISKSVISIFPGVKDFGLFDVFQRVYNTGKPEHFPTAFYKDSRIAGWRDNYVYKLPSGEIVAVYTDETARKMFEEERENLQAQLSNALEMARLGHWEFDVVNDLFTFNDHFYKIFHTTAEQIGGYTMSSAEYAHRFVHPDDMYVVEKEIRKAIETTDPHFSRQLEHRVLYANGTVGYVTVRFFIVKDAQGRTAKTYGVNQDITDRKRAEEALQESEKKYRNLFENLYDVYYRTDAKGVITLLSPSVEKYFDYTPDELIGQNMKNFYVNPQRREEFLSLLIKDGYVDNFEAQLKRKDNSLLWVSTNAKLLKDEEGNFIGVEGITRDVTYSKKLEEQIRQSQKMESIGTLAGGIAHDFNNILGIILGNTELALDDVPEWNPARQNLEEVRTAILRAKDVVRQLLSFARKTKLEKKPTNIVPIVKESLKLLRSSIPSSIDIRQNIPEDIGTILADPTQINQVLINLCTNADHAMPDGGVIAVTLKNIEINENTKAKYPELAPGCYVKLTVADTGQGISQEVINRIFDPYFTTKEIGRGTGMGLAVVHGIVKGHNGLITVESELGKGTTFSIFFPVVKKEAVIETKTDDKIPTGEERILFIDDEESIAKLGRQSLERLGYKVKATISPMEALELFRSQPDEFDLVITDLTMPKMTGDKLVKEILNIRTDIPIILCTGFSDKIDEKKAKEIGAANFIEKPINQRDFAFKVRKVLDGE